MRDTEPLHSRHHRGGWQAGRLSCIVAKLQQDTEVKEEGEEMEEMGEDGGLQPSDTIEVAVSPEK